MTKNLAKLYPEKIGYCLQPGSWWSQNNQKMSYFVDNGAFSDYCQNRPFRDEAFLNLVKKASGAEVLPDFVVVPDRVNSQKLTREWWETWAPQIREINPKLKLAYVVQPDDLGGGFPKDIPDDADLIFIGGTKLWKFSAVLEYKKIGLPIHVGGISASKLYWCHLQGVSSSDSSGFFRGDMNQLQKLYNYLADASGELQPLVTPTYKRQNSKNQQNIGQLSLF